MSKAGPLTPEFQEDYSMERQPDTTEKRTPCGRNWLYACPMRRAMSGRGMTYAPVARKLADAERVRAPFEAAYHCSTDCPEEACLRRTGGMIGSPRALAWERENVKA